jgi:hypothetical protein
MRFALAVGLLLTAAPLLAWGEKGHEISAEAATFGLPNEMPRFFHDAYPQLIYYANDPDRWRGSGLSLEDANPPDHFLDYEYVSALALPPERYAYLHLLETSGTLRKYGITNSSPGFLPWRVAELCDLLTTEWRLWRSAPSVTARRAIETSIIEHAGILGHFVADAANPQHTTNVYNGWWLPNPEHFRNDCDVHARFERDFINRAIDVKNVIPRLAPPLLRSAWFDTEMAQIHQSNSLVTTLYRIDRDGGFDGRGTPESVDFAASRLASGASMLRDLWWSTYRAGMTAKK